MKVAVCYFGQPKFVDAGYVTADWFTEDISIDNYFHFWQPCNNLSADLNSLSRFDNNLNESITLNELIQIYNPIDYQYDTQKDFDETVYDFVSFESFFIKPKRVMSMLYSIEQVINLVSKEYDYIFLKRSDVFFDQKINLETLSKDHLNLPSYTGDVQPLYNFVTNPLYLDFMAIGTFKTIQLYSKLFSHLIKYNGTNKAWVPEYLYSDYIVDMGLDVNKIELGKLYTNRNK